MGPPCISNAPILFFSGGKAKLPWIRSTRRMACLQSNTFRRITLCEWYTVCRADVWGLGGCSLRDGQSFHSAGKGMIWCQMRSPHARTDEDGPSSRKSGFQRKFSSLLESTVDAVRIFPWEKVYARFIQRVLDLFWIAAKWLAIPVLALSTLSEFVYTLSARKDLFIPLGILSGVLVAKIVGKASLEVVKELQDVKTPWPLVVMGLLFILLKLPGPYYPSWAAAFLPHVANAGLVQTILLFREWQQISV